jgi:hypothetical protein
MKKGSLAAEVAGEEIFVGSHAVDYERFPVDVNLYQSKTTNLITFGGDDALGRLGTNEQQMAPNL